MAPSSIKLFSGYGGSRAYIALMIFVGKIERGFKYSRSSYFVFAQPKKRLAIFSGGFSKKIGIECILNFEVMPSFREI